MEVIRRAGYHGTFLRPAPSTRSLFGLVRRFPEENCNGLENQVEKNVMETNGRLEKSKTAVSRILLILLAASVSPLCFAAGPPAAATQPLVAPDGSEIELPSWLTLGVEVRGRAETGTAPSFRPGTRASHYLHRLRIDSGFRLTPWLRIHGRFQDSRVAGWDSASKPGGIENTLEIGEAFAEFGVGEGPGWGAVIGRQPVVFGAMRVMSTSNWGNVGPRWDGLRAFYRADRLRLDLVAAAPVRPVDGRLDRWFSPGRRVFGLHGSVGRVPAIDLVEPYIFGFTFEPSRNESGHFGGRAFSAFGARIVDKAGPRFDFEMEITGLAGDAGGDPIRAWGAVGEIGRRLSSDPESPRLFARHQFATGDKNPHDGRMGGFQHMYATDKWGTADNAAWRNIHESVFGIALTPSQRLTLLLQGRTLWLATRRDALYTVSGAPAAFNPQATSNHVGEEMDIRVIWQVRRSLQLYGGYGYLLPGRFLEQSSPGASRHIAYLMWTLRM